MGNVIEVKLATGLTVIMEGREAGLIDQVSGRKQETMSELWARFASAVDQADWPAFQQLYGSKKGNGDGRK